MLAQRLRLWPTLKQCRHGKKKLRPEITHFFDTSVEDMIVLSGYKMLKLVSIRVFFVTHVWKIIFL